MMHELAILTWKEWRQHRLSLVFLLILIPVCLYSGILLFGPASPSGTLALMGSAAGGSFLIGLMAFTGELWVGEQRTQGLSFLQRLPCSPRGPVLVKWLWALLAPMALGLYGMLVGYIAVLLFGQSDSLGAIFVTERGLVFVLAGVSFGFWMLALGRLLPRTGVGILLALLIHLGPIGTWALLPDLLHTWGSFPSIATLLIPIAISGAILAATLPMLLGMQGRTRTWCFTGLGSLLLLSSGAGIVNLLAAYGLDPEDSQTSITYAQIGHGERFALLTYAGLNTEETYLVDLDERESQMIRRNYTRRDHLTRKQFSMGIPARRTWKAVSKHALSGMHLSTLLIERTRTHGHRDRRPDDRLLDLENGVLHSGGTLTVQSVQDKISLCHRRASPLRLADGRRVWVGADGVIMAANEGEDGGAWQPGLLAGATDLRGRGLQILKFAPDGGKATQAWLDPTRGRIFPLQQPGAPKMHVELIRHGAWVVRMSQDKQFGPWQLWDPLTHESRHLFDASEGHFKNPRPKLSKRRGVVSLALAGDDRLLYLDANLVLHVIDPEAGKTIQPPVQGTASRPLLLGTPGRRHSPLFRHRGRLAAGLDVYEVVIGPDNSCCFVFDCERDQVRVAPRSIGRPFCVGTKGVYFRSGNKLHRYDFTTNKPELLFPTPGFRNNPALGTPPSQP